MPNKDTSFSFQGFYNPTTTPVPDEVFDSLLYFLTDPELRVLMYIIRRTFGFKKDADNISLKQLVEGIKTKDGRVLDLGTGISKPTVTKAVKGLVEKGVITAERNRSKERGDEPTTYMLRFRDTPVLNDFTRGGKDSLHGGVKQDLHGGVNALNTQQTVIQETVYNNVVVVEQPQKNSINQKPKREPNSEVYKALIAFGVKEHGAKPLAENYPEETIMDKLAFVQWLVAEGSPLVRKNPAGYLIRAIERDIDPPKNYESPSGRKAKSERQAKLEAAETEKRKQAEIEYCQAQEEIQKRIRENYPPEPIGKDGLTTESAWTLTLKSMQKKVSTAAFQTWLKNTMLVSLEGNTANVVVPSQYTADWIESRMYQSLNRTFTDIIGQEADFRFIPAVTPQLAMEPAPDPV